MLHVIPPMRYINKYIGEKTFKTSVVSIMGIALLFTAIAVSLPYFNSMATAQKNNQTSNGGGQNNTGIGNVKTIPNIANLPPGNNTKIIMNNKNIANPNTFKAFGNEHGINASTPSNMSQLPKNNASG
jgi:hypothetical protein